MWRKVASLESYVFILEKRLNNMKKDITIMNTNNGVSTNDNDKLYSPDEVSCKITCIDKKCSNDEAKCYINDMIMNEVFGGCKKSIYDNIDLPVANSAGENINIEYEDKKANADDEIDNVLNTVLDVKKPPKSSSPIPSVVASTINNVVNTVPETKSSEEKNPETKKEEKIEPVQEKKDEECSETTINKKKLRNMPIDTLKELCIAHGVSPEGTKSILIDRLSAL
jgi:hypothetical protein